MLLSHPGQVVIKDLICLIFRANKILWLLSPALSLTRHHASVICNDSQHSEVKGLVVCLFLTISRSDSNLVSIHTDEYNAVPYIRYYSTHSSD